MTATRDERIAALLADYVEVEVTIPDGIRKDEDLIDCGLGALDETGKPRRNWPDRIVGYEAHPWTPGLGRIYLRATDPVYAHLSPSWRPVNTGERIKVLREKGRASCAVT